MKLKELKDHLQKLPDDYDVKVSSHIIAEGETDVKYYQSANEQFIAINDESILGISRKDDAKLIQIIGIQSQAPHFGTGDFSKDTQ
jgi:non-homologous end joining protein Ku